MATQATLDYAEAEGNAIMAKAKPADAKVARWRDRHAVDIRFSIPLPFGRYYLTVLADRERRSSDRLRRERRSHPLRTVGNVLFLLSWVVGLYFIAIAAMLVGSTIIE